MNKVSKRADQQIDKRRLRMWIRMLRTTRSAESKLREMLREDFGTTLPRFDVMAALERSEKGLKMSALSKQLLVSNGNVTGIVDRLVVDGLVERVMVENDRRSTLVCLSREGRKSFVRMADEHARLVNDLFSQINNDDLNALGDIFARLKEKEDDHDQDG